MIVKQLSGPVYWVMNHLVALGFAGFVLVLVVFSDAFFPAASPPSSSDPGGQPPVELPRKPPGEKVQARTPETPGLQTAPVEEPASPDPVQQLVEPGIPTQVPAPVVEVQQEAVFKPVETVVAPANETVDLGLDGTSPGHAPVEERVAAPAVRSRAEALKSLLVQAARKAFWDGELEAAESAYLAYLEQFPEDANVHGELGNLYQSMGRTGEALDAYVRAGQGFLAMGDMKQLAQIVDLLQEADDPRAATLVQGIPGE